MSVRVSIYFRCSRDSEAYWWARADASETRRLTNQRKCSKTRVRAWMMPLSSAHFTARVLKGATQLVGAGRDRETSVQRKNWKSFGHTTSKRG